MLLYSRYLGVASFNSFYFQAKYSMKNIENVSNKSDHIFHADM